MVAGLPIVHPTSVRYRVVEWGYGEGIGRGNSGFIETGVCLAFGCLLGLVIVGCRRLGPVVLLFSWGRRGSVCIESRGGVFRLWSKVA